MAPKSSQPQTITTIQTTEPSANFITTTTKQHRWQHLSPAILTTSITSTHNHNHHHKTTTKPSPFLHFHLQFHHQ
jgi:hypothetical protein